MVMGVQYDGRSEIVENCVVPQLTVFLVRDPLNPFDANAVRIMIDVDRCIGYVPRELAAIISPLLERGFRQLAYCTKVLEGSRALIPVVQVALYAQEASVPGALTSEEVTHSMPAVRESPGQKANNVQEKSKGCWLTCLACLGLVSLLVLAFSC